MNILSFELANFKYSIALSTNDKGIEYFFCDDFRNSDKSVLPKIQSLITKHNINFHDFDYVATLTGPGSFTGIRMGLAIAKGFAICLQKPSIGITTTEILINKYLSNNIVKQNILLVTESKRSELYTQLFDCRGNALENTRFLTPHEINTKYQQNKFDVVGDGVKHLEKYDINTIELIVDARDIIDFIPHIKDTSKYPCVPSYVRPADTG